MVTLMVIGLLSGIVTGVSPCILPVLPAVLTVSAVTPEGVVERSSSRWRPLIVVAGLVTSFAVVTLIGATLLSALGLPEDLLRTIGLVAMVALGIGLLLPVVGRLLERPFARIPQVRWAQRGSGFFYGMTFGLAFVPCAGPVLATITVLAATSDVRSELVILTAAFSVGVAFPLLALAIAGQRMTQRIAAFRTRMPLLRRVTGAVLVATALAVFLGVTDQAQRLVPGYVEAVQQRIEDNDAARTALAALSATAQQGGEGTVAAGSAVGIDEPLGSAQTFNACEQDPSRLQNCGPARPFVRITEWLNTPGNEPINIASLKGRVVLVDFWTYSCINCQRTLPYLTAWDAKYRDKGLTIIGVHAPEFAFERVVDNVAEQAAVLGVKYPIAIDNDFATWRAYNQRYWPAHYLIDKNGIVRQVHYGEGAYDNTEALIRTLLDADSPLDPPAVALG